jgi:multidrug resistance efflux pump
MNTTKRHGRIKSLVAGLLLLGAAGLGGLYFLHLHRAAAEDNPGEEEEAEVNAVLVKTIRPQKNPDFALRVQRPANVEAYYRAKIEARVAGEVSWIEVAPGTEVNKGDLLVKVSVPDLDADAVQKCELVGQRKQEWELAKAAVDTAKANIEEKATLLKSAVATTQLRELEFKRIDGLYRRNAIDKEARDEADKNREVAKAGEEAARAAKKKAEAEEKDAEIKVQVAAANIKVAEAACKAAKALADYALVRAPWTGTVVDRHVNPGSFVQNASTGHPSALVTMERTDIVTVAMRVPDNVALFVTPETEAVLELLDLPGVKIRGKVTRIAKTLETKDRDRTMRVEMDLWNSDASKYKAFLDANYVWNDPKQCYEQKIRTLEAYKALENKGDYLKDGPPPVVPQFEGKERDLLQRDHHLIADMYGKMTLILKSFADSYLVPSVAVFHEGGREYVYVVQEKVDENGKLQKIAHKVPVRVQLDDGNMAKLVLVGKDEQILGELTGKEEVVVSNQEELSEGQTLATDMQEDWNALKQRRGH